MYVCGITPYDATHVGHAATFLAYDVLQRRLRDLGWRTRCVRNITDVDDDLLARARAMGVHYLDLAAGSLAAFDADMEALGLLPAHSEPRATSAISDIRRVIGQLLDSGHAYRSGEGVYFDVSTAPGFGELSRLSVTEMIELARRRGGRPDDPDKRNLLDFVLWQRAAPDEPEWSSLWGPGRPGWHVECSALALAHLGQTIDVHGGGSDLVFPHHECSRAQSEAVTGGLFVRHWMHTSMVRQGGAKMSKSAGNLVCLCPTCASAGSPWRCGWRCWVRTIGPIGTGMSAGWPMRPGDSSAGGRRVPATERCRASASVWTTISTRRARSQQSTPPSRTVSPPATQLPCSASCSSSCGKRKQPRAPARAPVALASMAEPDDLGEVRDELPADLDRGFVGAYKFPDNSRRKITGALCFAAGVWAATAALAAEGESVLLNEGVAVGGVLLALAGLYQFAAGRRFAVNENEALVAAVTDVGFAVGARQRAARLAGPDEPPYMASARVFGGRPA